MKKIWIDAGHGGSDPGACNGQHQEKTYALGIALKLGEILSGRGYSVNYSRKGDSYISLGGRCQNTNNWGADLFISIHLNASTSASGTGIETLCYSGASQGGKLAQIVQAKLIQATGLRDRGIKERTGLAVLKGTKMPAILVEAGFISNYNDLNKIITNEYRNQVANAIADGVDEYFGYPTPISEYTDPAEIIKELENRGIVTDAKGMLQEIAEKPNGRLYWICRKTLQYMKEHNT